MDTTVSSVGGIDEAFLFSTGYVSCIQVDGQPILPPLMSGKRREEMRRYKQQAIIREKELIQRKINKTVTVEKDEEINHKQEYFNNTISSPPGKCLTQSEQTKTELKTSSTPPISPRSDEVPLTSTPVARRNSSMHSTKSSKMQFSAPYLPGHTDVPENVLREKQVNTPDYYRDNYNNGDGSVPLIESHNSEDKCDDAIESEDAISEDNFASAASSTGTFVIRRSDEANFLDNTPKNDSIENFCNASSSEEEHGIKRKDTPQTVLRKMTGDDNLFKRKRPAKYFDLEDDVNPNETRSSTYSIPNYVSGHHTVDKTSTINLSATSSKFSPVPLTNFSTLAKSLTMEFAKKFCSTSSLTDKENDNEPLPQKGTVGVYDVVLSNRIPSSAEKVSEDEDSNSSDKENVDMTVDSTKHVRKLSYTLATPSAALLDSLAKPSDLPQPLETIPSGQSSRGGESASASPEKPTAAKMEGHSHDGKQAHLERFLGEQKQLSMSKVVSSKSTELNQMDPVMNEMQKLLKRMQEEHETQLHRLAEEHRRRELRLRQEFENEMGKLKDKFSSTLNTTDSSKDCSKTSPTSTFDSVNYSRQSEKTGASLSDTKLITLPSSATVKNFGETKKEPVASERSEISEVQDKSKDCVSYSSFGKSFAWTSTTHSSSTLGNSGIGGPTDLSAIGLSKLQNHMQLMSPKLFRNPVDTRSPLLKGIVFLDPLNKPVAPLRIPPKALCPDMKPKFDRVTAAVKGFLIRRLLNTEKVQIIVQTIRDTVDLLLKLYEEASSPGLPPVLKSQDNDLHQRLVQQLTGACRSFHEVFFKLSIKERMAIISTDREKLRAKALRAVSSPVKSNISNATLKSIERRMSNRSSPKRDRKMRNSRAIDHYRGSLSVKPKQIKTFNLSPKRRRISYWGDRTTVVPSSMSSVGNQGLNNNNRAVPSGKSRSNPQTVPDSMMNYQFTNSGRIGETFIVPPVVQTPRNARSTNSNTTVKSYYVESLPGRGDSVTPSNIKSVSARSTQSSISGISSSSANKSRASTSRQPWNSGRT